jgi:hypothetical protein
MGYRSRQKSRIIDSPIASRAPKQVEDSGLLPPKFYVTDIFIGTRLVDRWRKTSCHVIWKEITYYLCLEIE